jgi:hypothetical protein
MRQTLCHKRRNTTLNFFQLFGNCIGALFTENAGEQCGSFVHAIKRVWSCHLDFCEIKVQTSLLLRNQSGHEFVAQHTTTQTERRMSMPHNFGLRGRATGATTACEEPFETQQTQKNIFMTYGSFKKHNFHEAKDSEMVRGTNSYSKSSAPLSRAAASCVKTA